MGVHPIHFELLFLIASEAILFLNAIRGVSPEAMSNEKCDLFSLYYLMDSGEIFWDPGLSGYNTLPFLGSFMA